MSDEAVDAEAARDSVLLYNLCCDVGFSREQWEQHIRQSDINNTLDSYRLRSDRVCSNCLHCGSSAEGVAASILGSDLDVLMPIQGVRVIERGPIPDRATQNIFQFVPTEHAAYVRLQLVAIGDRQIETVRGVLECCETDESGRTVFNGQLLLGRVASEDSTQHGPAITDRVSKIDDIDGVLCLHYDEWPNVQTEWVNRHRPYNWPSPVTVKEIVDNGCELVAVGHPSSQAPHFEWRLSSSRAEKMLVRSFNIYQIQCYFLLKLILVFLINPLVPHTLCSYHMKTIILHVVETTDPADWTRHNLTRCLMKCISVLLRFLEDGNCPQYFIPQHNLFDPKVRGETQRNLVRIVKELQAEGWKCVLRCVPFSQLNTQCQHVFPRCPCFIKHWHQVKVEGLLNDWYARIIYLNGSVLYYLQEQGQICFLDSVKCLLHQNSVILEDDKVHLPCRSTVTKLQLFAKSIIGYSLLAVARCRNSNDARLLGPILQCARQLLQASCDFDVTSCRLKLATFYYQTGQRNQCIAVVKETLENYTEGTLPVCEDYVRMKPAVNEEYKRRLICLLLFGSDVDTLFRHVAFPVTFSRWEIISKPTTVRYLYRSRPRITDTDKENHSILFIDPLVYACYLLVICYHDLGDLVKSRQTLELMGRTMLNHRQHYLFYPEVARLLLDYCVQYTADHR